MRRIAMGGLWAAVLFTSASCSLYELPETGPAREEVFEQARRVILERYPMATAIVNSNLVVAVTPATMEGGVLGKRQITVWIERNYTGAWEPRVQVTHHVDTAEPPLESQPDSPVPVLAHPVVWRDWKPLTFLPYEAEELQQRILEALYEIG